LTQPGLAKVTPSQYRNESSGIYYALVERHSKQFRQSPKISDPKRAGGNAGLRPKAVNSQGHSTACGPRLSGTENITWLALQWSRPIAIGNEF